MSQAVDAAPSEVDRVSFLYVMSVCPEFLVPLGLRPVWGLSPARC